MVLGDEGAGSLDSWLWGGKIQAWVIAKTPKPFLVKGRGLERKWVRRGRVNVGVKSQGWVGLQVE